MRPRSFAFSGFSIFPALVLEYAVVFSPVGGDTALAQTPTPTTNSEPAARTCAAGKVKAKSKETWEDMKERWAKQKERWADCQTRERSERRGATASRAFLEACMK